MFFIRFAIENPVKVTVAVLLSVLFGIIALIETPVQLTPDVSEPEITVTTRWPGAGAQEVEREIVDEQEEQLKSVEGLREFKSESQDSVASIVLKFETGTDLADARARVDTRLSQVPEYPADAQEPVITTVNPNANAIAWFILKPVPPTPQDLQAVVEAHPQAGQFLNAMIAGTEPIELSILQKHADKFPILNTIIGGKNDASRMRRLAEDEIEARFERVGGVGNANVFGGYDQEFRIVVDPSRLAGMHLSIGDLRRALLQQNRNTSGGTLWEGKQQNSIRTLGEFDSPEKVGETIIAIRDNTPIRVSDVARVELSYKKPDGVVRQKGINGLAINAQQSPGTNVLTIMGPEISRFDLNGDGRISQVELAESKARFGDSLRLAMVEMNEGILKQQGLMLEQVYDQTDYVNSATELVTNSIFVGSFLAILVLLVTLRSIRSVFIIGLTIPISVIATFLFVRGFGRSINVISLAGMSFAVGMVVDNAIVVLENIYRRYQLGDDPDKAAAKGTFEVWGAVLASTLTTLAVFVPVIFVKGQAGQLFRDISIAISCAVGLSLIVSITVIPTAARRLLGRRGKNHDISTSQSTLFGLAPLAQGAINRFSDAMSVLLTIRGSIVLRLLVVAFFVCGSVWGAYALAPDTEYLPQGNRNLVIAILIPPPGYNIDHMIEIGKRVESRMATYWESLPGSPEAKQLKGPRIDNFFFVARGRMLFMGARSVDPLRAAELVPVMQQAASGIPGVIAIAQQSSLFESALTGGRTIDVEITGPDLEKLVLVGQQVWGLCMKEFPMDKGNQLRPIPSLDLSSPELHVTPKLAKAAELGVTATDLGYAIDALVDGAFSGDYWHEGNKIDLVIYGADDYVRNSQDLASLPIATPTGKVVTVSALADVDLASGPEQVNHSERQRTITISLVPAPNIALESAMRTINDKIRLPMLEIPELKSGLYQIRLAGTADKLDETRMDLQWNLVLAFVITYLLMAALFESFFFPVVIMTSVLLALVGGFAGLAILNVFTIQALDMLTMLGFVILIGTVVNNAILIVHQSLNNMRDEGMADQEAIVESVRTRIRPIFMSTTTTVLGMLPLVLPIPNYVDGQIMWLSGAGSELYRGLGSVVLGGLIVSTVFTLVLVPVGFSLMLDFRRWMAPKVGLPPVQPPGAGEAERDTVTATPSRNKGKEPVSISD